jgi:hypothetical protein
MKKILLVLIAVVLLAGMFTSCNKSVCPAYVKDVPAVQVENNS